MKISYSKKHINLQNSQVKYITKKIDHLKSLARRIDDSSSHAEIEIAKENTNPNNISMVINFKVPSQMFRAEVLAKSPEEAIDKCEEKLKVQIEKYKAKFIKNDMHNNSKHNGKVAAEADEFSDLL